MSTAVPAALQAKLDSGVTTFADYVEIFPRDGSVLRFTGSAQDSIVGGNTFLAANGFRRSAAVAREGLSVDNQDLHGIIDGEVITESDIAGGRFQGALVVWFVADYLEPDDGMIELDVGLIGRITLKENQWIAEFRSLTAMLNAEIGDAYGPLCPHKLGDSRCGVQLDPPTWAEGTYAIGYRCKASVYDNRRYEVVAVSGLGDSGSAEPVWNTTLGGDTPDGDLTWRCLDGWQKEGAVDAPVGEQAFDDAARAEADHWYRFGEIEWLSGLNTGLKTDVKDSSNAGRITLRLPMPNPIAVGDQYRLTVGCNHLLKMPGDLPPNPYTGDCRSKFDNVPRFGGHADIPTTDDSLRGAQ